MSALGGGGDAPPLRAHGPLHKAFHGAVKGDQLLDAALVIGTDLPHALEIAQTLFTAVEYQQQRAADQLGIFQQILGAQHKRHHIGSIVTYTGGIELALLLPHRELSQVGKDHVGMSGKNGITFFACHIEGQDHVEGLVHSDVLRALLLQPCLDECNAPVLLMRGGGDGCQLLQQCQLQVFVGFAPGDHRDVSSIFVLCP